MQLTINLSNLSMCHFSHYSQIHKNSCAKNMYQKYSHISRQFLAEFWC